MTIKSYTHLHIYSSNLNDISLNVYGVKYVICVNHCVKSVQIREFFWSIFSQIRTEYEIQSEFTFSPNVGNYGPKKVRIWTLFTQWCYIVSLYGKIVLRESLCSGIFYTVCKIYATQNMKVCFKFFPK